MVYPPPDHLVDLVVDGGDPDLIRGERRGTGRRVGNLGLGWMRREKGRERRRRELGMAVMNLMTLLSFVRFGLVRESGRG